MIMSSVSVALQCLSPPWNKTSGANEFESPLLSGLIRRDYLCSHGPGVSPFFITWSDRPSLSSGVTKLYLTGVTSEAVSTLHLVVYRDDYTAVTAERILISLDTVTMLPLRSGPPVVHSVPDKLNSRSRSLPEANLFQSSSSQLGFTDNPWSLFSKANSVLKFEHIQPLQVPIGAVSIPFQLGQKKTRYVLRPKGLFSHVEPDSRLEILGVFSFGGDIKFYLKATFAMACYPFASVCPNSSSLLDWFIILTRESLFVCTTSDYALNHSKHPCYSGFSSFLKRYIPSERERSGLITAHLHRLDLCLLSYLSSFELEAVLYRFGETMLVWFFKQCSSFLTTFCCSLEDVHMSIQRLMILPSISVGAKPLLWLNWCLQSQLSFLISYCRPLSQARNLPKATRCMYKSIVSRVSKSTAYTGTRSFFSLGLFDTTKYPISRAADLSSTMSYYTSCQIFLAAPKRVIDLNSRLHPYLGYFVCFNKHLSHRKLYGVLCDIHILPLLLEALSSIIIVIFPWFRAVVCIRLSDFTIVLKLYVIF